MRFMKLPFMKPSFQFTKPGFSVKLDKKPGFMVKLVMKPAFLKLSVQGPFVKLNDDPKTR